MINLYLDKNYLQNFTNLNKPNNSVYKELFDQLLSLQKDNKVRVFRSSLHEIECSTEALDYSSRANLNRKILHSTLPKIKSVRLIDYQEIRDQQFIGYLFKFLGINKGFAFENIQIIDKYQGYDYQPWLFKKPYSGNNTWFNNEPIEAFNDRIKNSNMKSNQWFKEELNAMRKVFLKRYEEGNDFFAILKETLSISESQIKLFLDSSSFSVMPYVNIFCRLFAKFSSQKQNAHKDDLNHYFFDILAASAYLPYCEIFCTDREMQIYIQEGKLNNKATVYSAKKGDVDKLLLFLKNI